MSTDIIFYNIVKASLESIAYQVGEFAVFKPNMAPECRDRLLDGWRKAVASTRGWAK